VPWNRKTSFRLIALKDVRRLTGLEPAELLLRTDSQQLTRVAKGGAREELVRVPTELLIEIPED
jgi:hypothetical protein